MNILIIGENNSNSLERIYQKNFLKLKCKKVNIVTIWKPKNYLLKKTLNFFEKNLYLIYCLLQNYLLKKKIKKDNRIYDTIIVFNGYQLDYKTISFLNKKALKSLINIQTDNIFTKKNIIKDNIQLFDKIYVWSKKIKIKIIRDFKIKINKIHFLPFGFDQSLILYSNKKTISNIILFYGSWDQNRENILSYINPNILKIYGNGWNKASATFKKKYIIRSELIGNKLTKQISKSLLSLNLFRPQAKNYINMRSFEVLGYNGTLFSEYSKEQLQFFPKNNNIIYIKNFKKINDLFKKIVLKKKLVIKNRSINKFKMNKHSYFNRAKFVLDNEKNLPSK